MNDDLNSALAAVLRAERAAQSLTFRQLADRSGLPEKSIEAWLAPKGTRAIKVAVLEALADALGVSAHELLERAGERRRFKPPQGDGFTDIPPA